MKENYSDMKKSKFLMGLALGAGAVIGVKKLIDNTNVTEVLEYKYDKMMYDVDNILSGAEESDVSESAKVAHSIFSKFPCVMTACMMAGDKLKQFNSDRAHKNADEKHECGHGHCGHGGCGHGDCEHGGCGHHVDSDVMSESNDKTILDEDTDTKVEEQTEQTEQTEVN